MNTPLFALLRRHLICLPCGVAALIVCETDSVCVLLVDKFASTVYAYRHDRLVRGVAAIYGSELGIVYLVDVLVKLQELRHAELAEWAVSQHILHGVSYPLCTPTECDDLLGKHHPKGYLCIPCPSRVSGVHSGEIDCKAENVRHYILIGGGRQCTEYRQRVITCDCVLPRNPQGLIGRYRRGRLYVALCASECLCDCFHSVRF